MACQFQVKEKARQYLLQAPHAISGQGGHNLTFRVAIDLVQGFGLSQEDALLLMREWNERCQPAWSDCELKHKVEDAEKAEIKKPSGWLCSSSGRVRYILPTPLDFDNDIVISERNCLFLDYCPDGFSMSAFNNGVLTPQMCSQPNFDDSMPEVHSEYDDDNYYGDPF